MRRHGVLNELPMNRLSRSAPFVLTLALSLFAVHGVMAEPSCSTVTMRVEGGSMSPRIAPGQLIKIQQGSPSCLGTLKHGKHPGKAALRERQR